MSYWLVKSEPDVYSIEDFAREKRTLWEGVRNYQARNFLRSMKHGEGVLFYHSSCDEVGVAGVGRVNSREALPDKLQFDPKSEYFDEKSSRENPRWYAPELAFERKFPSVVTLSEIKGLSSLKKMELLKKGSRLSVQPVTEEEFRVIIKLGQSKR